MTDGLTPGNYGWSMTVKNLREKCPPEVELRFVAIVLPELFQGLDFDEELWPYPFTPECLLLALQRALGRENHLTRSNKEHDLAVRIIRFFKRGDRREWNWTEIEAFLYVGSLPRTADDLRELTAAPHKLVTRCSSTQQADRA